MIKFISSLLTIMLCVGLMSVQAQKETVAKTQEEVAEAKPSQKKSKFQLLKELEDRILEANEDEMGVKLITAERDLKSLFNEYKDNKFGKPMKEMTIMEKKENMNILINDEQFINLRKQKDIAKIEKEEYLLENNKEYAELMAEFEKAREARMAKAKANNAKNGNSKMGKGNKGSGKAMKGGRKGGTPKGLLRKR